MFDKVKVKGTTADLGKFMIIAMLEDRTHRLQMEDHFLQILCGRLAGNDDGESEAF